MGAPAAGERGAGTLSWRREDLIIIFMMIFVIIMSTMMIMMMRLSSVGAWGAEEEGEVLDIVTEGNLVVDTHGDNDEHDADYDGIDDHVDLGGWVGARDLVHQSRGWGGGGGQQDFMKLIVIIMTTMMKTLIGEAVDVSSRLQRDQEFSIPGFPGRDFAKSRDPRIFRDGIVLNFLSRDFTKKV